MRPCVQVATPLLHYYTGRNLENPFSRKDTKDYLSENCLNSIHFTPTTPNEVESTAKSFKNKNVMVLNKSALH